MLAPTFNDLVEALIAIQKTLASKEKNELVVLILKRLKELLER